MKMYLVDIISMQYLMRSMLCVFECSGMCVWCKRHHTHNKRFVRCIDFSSNGAQRCAFWVLLASKEWEKSANFEVSALSM